MLLLNLVLQLFGTEGCTLVKSVQGFFFKISLEIWLLQVSLKSCEIIGRLCPPPVQLGLTHFCSLNWTLEEMQVLLQGKLQLYFSNLVSSV